MRLNQIHQGLCAVIEAYHPLSAAVEETFVNKNPRSTLKLGQARGVAMLAPAQAGLEVSEYAANLIKKSVVGTGHAQKDQVAMMVTTLLPAAGKVKDDAADALAVAICHANNMDRLRVSAGFRDRL
jgi:crossover junction endodeoxyribonuclease RuvC